MNKKIIFIPGWLDQGKNFPQFESVLEIWKENIKPDIELVGDVIIAHSLGCHFALFDIDKIKYRKIIFVNPAAVKKNPLVWSWRWIKFRFYEKQSRDRKYIKNPIMILRAVFYYFKFLTRDIFSLLDDGNCDMVVIRGKKDIFFCDDESCQLLRSKKINVIELDDVGHLWNKKIDEEIRKIIGE